MATCKKSGEVESVSAGTSGTGQANDTSSGGSSSTSGAATSSPVEPGSTGVDSGASSSGGDESTTTGTGACRYDVVDGNPAFSTALVGSGFSEPVLALGHPTDPDRLFVANLTGELKILEPGEIQAPQESVLSLDVNLDGETGLLGFAFHPEFPADPRLYVAHSPTSTPLVTAVSEFVVTDGGQGIADAASERMVIAATQPAGNHNGGMIAFGPDGYLYLGLGDGGGAGDQFGTGRDRGVLLSKLLRIGVEPDGTPDTPVSCAQCPTTPGPFDYTIPSDNPFVGDSAFAPEIYAWGLRNPWRFSFDPLDGVLYLADVGQNAYEEVDVVTAGEDFGWSTMEGAHCYGGATCDTSAGPNRVNADGMTMPIAEYALGGRADRCSIAMLGTYRSCEVPEWNGVHLYGDYCSGEIFGLRWDGQTVTELGVVANVDGPIYGGGSNARGDVFVTVSGPGRVFRIAPASGE